MYQLFIEYGDQMECIYKNISLDFAIKEQRELKKDFKDLKVEIRQEV